jgi:6-phosphogluconolactonase
MKLKRRLFLILGLLALCGPLPGEEKAHSLTVYAGTYTGGKSQGIYLFRFDPASGKASKVELAAKTESPSFLALHPSGRFLYSVGEMQRFEGKPSGALSAFAIEPESGKLKLLNQEQSGGQGPCHLVVHPDGTHLVAANYGSGSVCAYRLDENGRLAELTDLIQHQGKSADPRRQEGPHAHCVGFDRAGRFLLAADLGLDKLLVYRVVGGKSFLQPGDPPSASLAPGAGPRHFVFHPGGQFAYVISEIACTVTGFSWDGAKGVLKEIETVSSLPGKVEPGYSTAEIEVHPSGKFLYGSNRGHDSIAVFAIARDGTLSPIQHQPTGGKTPRSFGIDPGGRYLLAANQDSGTIVVCRIDQETGRLVATGEVVEVPSPVCVKFLQGH